MRNCLFLDCLYIVVLFLLNVGYITYLLVFAIGTLLLENTVIKELS
jgi:hypothetical protein